MLAIVSYLAQYGGGGGGGGGGYSAGYWVIVALVAVVAIAAIAWAVMRIRGRRRGGAQAPSESNRTDRAA